MEFDNSWNALFNPGASEKYFDMRPLEAFQADISEYSAVNAWWLCEISRLIYKAYNLQNSEDKAGVSAGSPTRNEILKPLGLREEIFFNKANIRCAIIRSEENRKDPFSVLVFRGTGGFEGWFSNLNAIQVPWPGGGMVHAGFRNNFYEVWEEAEAALSSCNEPMFYTGHSLGAALATLAASMKKPRALYTFGSPRVGDRVFVQSLKDTNIYRVANGRDMVTTVPPSLIPFEFRHAGELHYISSEGRMLAKPSRRIVAEDRSKALEGVSGSSENGIRKQFGEPPKFLSDHSPVNYTAHLERLLKEEVRAAEFSEKN